MLKLLSILVAVFTLTRSQYFGPISDNSDGCPIESCLFLPDPLCGGWNHDDDVKYKAFPSPCFLERHAICTGEGGD